MEFSLSRDVDKLESVALETRRLLIRALAEAGSGHSGSALSAVELMVALYYGWMRHDPAQPGWADRDRFVLSKGHANPAWYSILAQAGYFDESELMKLRKLGSMLQGHPDMKTTPGVNMCAGSLGQGLSVANGMALAAKLDGRSYRVYAVLGDGENEEGQVWEAAMGAAHYKLDNLCAIIDNNGLQIDGPIAEVMSPEPLDEKWRAFGWHVIRANGHDFQQILEALEEAGKTKGRPSVIIAKTVKGKGVSFMENEVDWHGKAPSQEQAKQALAELGAAE